MLGYSRKLLYAIEAVIDIAYNTGGDPVQSSEITRRQGIPRRYLEPVLQQLVRARVLAGVRGPRGGYRLARERRRITVGDIARVIHALESGDSENEECSRSDLGQRVVQPLWRELQDETMARLDEISIEDLCLRARTAGVDSDAFKRLDYTI
jgi:Rrf2 family protein